MKLRFPKLNIPRIMGWLFILSIPAIPVSWLFFSPPVLIRSIMFFACMVVYQVCEVLYNDHKEKQRIASELTNIARLDGSTILDPIRTQRISITKHLFAFYSIHTRAITFQSKADRSQAEKLYHRGKWAPPSFNWFVDETLFNHLNKNLKA